MEAMVEPGGGSPPSSSFFFSPDPLLSGKNEKKGQGD